MVKKYNDCYDVTYRNMFIDIHTYDNKDTLSWDVYSNNPVIQYV